MRRDKLKLVVDNTYKLPKLPALSVPRLSEETRDAGDKALMLMLIVGLLTVITVPLAVAAIAERIYSVE